MTSPYAQVGAKIVDNGYSAIPILPGTKRPGQYQFGEWYSASDWARFCDRLPTPIETGIWDRWPDAGVCVPIDHKLKVIDIDTDDDTLMAAVVSVLPDSPVKKRGNKGFSAFYRGSPAIKSAPFSITTAGKPIRVVDLLAHGRQTVVPGTIHPDTGRRYEWLTTDTLVNTSIDQLPELPDNISDLLAEVLAPFGYTPTHEHRAIVAGDGDTMWREINDSAIANLDSWVPALRLPGTKRSGNGSYRAVAAWRGVESPNLAFHAKGIKDWGEDKAYTPIDVVIAAFSTDLYTATKWLCEQIGYSVTAHDDGFDVAAFVSRNQAKNIAKKAPATPLVIPPEQEPTHEAAPIVQRHRIAAPRGKLNPFDPMEADGLLGAIAEWICGTARRPVPEFAMLGAVAFLSVLYGRQFVGPTGLASNIYLVGIGGPGYGKDHPLRCVPLLAHDCGMNFLVGPGDVTSGSAIERVVRSKAVFFMPWDEFGVILQGMTGSNAQSWTKSIRKVLLELYSRSTSMWTGKENSDPKRASASAEPVYWPHVSILGMSTPTEFYAGITDSNLSDGLMARLTVIFSNARPGRQKTKSVLIPPPSLIAAIKDSVASFPKFKGNLSGNKDLGNWRIGQKAPPITEVPWETPQAEQRLEEIEDWQFSAIDDDPLLEGIVGRAGEQSVKLAMIRAVSRNPSSPSVSLADMEWGWAFVQRSLDSIDAGVKSYMVGSDFERLHKTILEHVTAAGKEGIRKSDLMKKRGVSRAKPVELESALRWNMDANLVVGKLVTPTNGGRPGTRYLASEFDVGVSDKKAAA